MKKKQKYLIKKYLIVLSIILLLLVIISSFISIKYPGLRIRLIPPGYPSIEFPTTTETIPGALCTGEIQCENYHDTFICEEICGCKWTSFMTCTIPSGGMSKSCQDIQNPTDCNACGCTWRSKPISVSTTGLTCRVTNNAPCDSDEKQIFSMSDTKNAMAGDATAYNNIVCCKGVTGLGNSCSDPNNAVVLKLSSNKNAHVAYKGTTNTNYGVSVCISGPNSGVDCGYYNNCPTDYVILASVNDTSNTFTNAHVGDQSAYSNKICCKVPGGTITTTPGGTTTTTIPQNCQILLNILEAAWTSWCVNPSNYEQRWYQMTGNYYNYVADVTRDKKVDISDNYLIANNMNNDAWCLDKLDDPDSCASGVTTTTGSTTTTTIPQNCQNLLNIAQAAFGSWCVDPSNYEQRWYQMTGNYYNYIADIDRDKNIDAKDISQISSNINNDVWCTQKLNIPDSCGSVTTTTSTTTTSTSTTTTTVWSICHSLSGPDCAARSGCCWSGFWQVCKATGEWGFHELACQRHVSDPGCGGVDCCYHCPNDALDCYRCDKSSPSADGDGWVNECDSGVIPHDSACTCKDYRVPSNNCNPYCFVGTTTTTTTTTTPTSTTTTTGGTTTSTTIQDCSSFTNACKIDCGGILTGRSMTTKEYFELNLDSTTDVLIEIIPTSNVDYDLYVRWDNKQPTETYYNCMSKKSTGSVDKCPNSGYQRLGSGTYYAMVKYYTGSGTYDISVTCLDVTTTTTGSTTTTTSTSSTTTTTTTTTSTTSTTTTSTTSTTTTSTTTTSTTTTTTSTTTTTIPGFTATNFVCNGIFNGWNCKFDYSNNLGESAVVVFYFSDSTSDEIKSSAAPVANTGSGTAGANVYCGTMIPSGTYYVSWRAYKSSDPNLSNQVNWSKSNQKQVIVC